MSAQVRAERLSKRFSVLRSRQTLLGTLRAAIRREPIRREHWVLRDVSFEIQPGDKVALLGRNGSGKTTLLRILAGIYEQTSGELLVTGRPRPFFNCTAGLRSEFSVVDNIYLYGALHGLSRRTLRVQESEILERTQLTHLAHSPLRELSAGQAQRLALTIFCETTSDFLILDEVAANIGNLDHGFRLELEGHFARLAQSAATLMMTSHDASHLRRFCRTALWLEQGEVREFGPVDRVLDEYEGTFAGVGTARPVARA